MHCHVGIFAFDEVEVLDFAGPFEVFSVASRVRLIEKPDAEPPFKVFVVGETLRTIQARGHLQITPTFDFSKHPPIDVLIIPGGAVTQELENDASIEWIRQVAKNAELTASVCTGAFLLAKAGLLEAKNATTHWEDIEDLRARFPGVRVKEEIRWIDEGKVLTSAGISAGLDMSLHIVARLEGDKLARDTARQMDYDWKRTAS